MILMHPFQLSLFCDSMISCTDRCTGKNINLASKQDQLGRQLQNLFESFKSDWNTNEKFGEPFRKDTFNSLLQAF